MIYYGNTLNPTWDYDWIARWSTIEVDFWVLAACMPGIRNFIKRWHPQVVGETTKAGVESIQPGLYEPQHRSSRRSEGSIVDEYIQNLEYFRIPEITNAAAARDMRMGMLWSRASVDLDQLELAGWNVTNRMSGIHNPTQPLDAILNAPLDDTGNATAVFGNATEPLPPLAPDEEERRGGMLEWFKFWRRRRGGSVGASMASSRNRSTKSHGHNDTTIVNSSINGDDIALEPIEARAASTVKSLDTVTTQSELGSGTVSDHKDYHAI